MNKDAEFLKRLLATFKVEAQEHLQGISSGLIELERERSEERQAEIVESVFREAHSLKGAARAVNLTEIESLCQAIEGVFSALKKKELPQDTELFDLLQEGVDFLGRLLSAPDTQRTPEEKIQQLEFDRRLQKLMNRGQEPGNWGQGTGNWEKPPEASPPSPEPRAPSQVLSETVRVSTAKLSSVLLQSEEMLSAKLSA